MPSNHLILCRPLLFPPSVFPIIGVFSSESALHIKWPKDWSFSFSISPSHEKSRLISFRIDWFGITNSRSSLKLTPIDSVMPSSHLILCHPLYLLPPIPPSIRVFSNESTLGIRWPKYWSFSFSISPSSEYSGLISFRIDWWKPQLCPEGHSIDWMKSAQIIENNLLT